MDILQPRVLHPFFFNEFKQFMEDDWSVQRILLEFRDYLREKNIPESQISSLSDIYVLKSLGAV